MDQHQAQPNFPPIVALGLGVLAASSAALFIRYAQADVPSLVIAAFRLLLAAVILAPVALLRHHRELRERSRWEFFLALLSGAFLAFHFAAWITSLEYTTVASSVVLVSTVPLWVALFSPIFLKESITRLALLGMLIALLGGAVITLSDTCTLRAGSLDCSSISGLVQGSALFGDLLALTGAIMAAAYVMLGRRLRSAMSLVGYVFLVYAMAGVVLLAVNLIAGNSFRGYPSQAYIWMILLALIPQLIGHTSFNWALRYISAGFVSIALLGEPIGSTILAYFFLDEMPSPIEIIGAILILVGIYLASRSEVNEVAKAN
jgi:drug/metabolite transporter (DMT)-like permease